MEGAATMKGIFGKKAASVHEVSEPGAKTTLLDAEIGRTYIVKEIDTEDEEMNAFLFRLGCYSGEPVTLISKKKKSCITVFQMRQRSLSTQCLKMSLWMY